MNIEAVTDLRSEEAKSTEGARDNETGVGPVCVCVCVCVRKQDSSDKKRHFNHTVYLRHVAT